ncbi:MULTISPECIES: CvpA family protein [unclassified Wenzhouxiangella]|uniref:CvpA family protein n=1 Tax=unclassified Wenzhouxiangella TaxID=2613841 RepID=UPI000E32BA9E|nr:MULTISPECIES: CvpA family protein [unclassified Wenzhouxiangella]RFF27633.1 CvpA family protein [Wenzhouxiangella sp. 15181]RFP70156.1 CvpA family protein [Wenzhouxiangella sp. 15190]
MNWADYAIIGIILLSMVVSLFRGFMREVFSLLVWIAAVYAALQAAGPLAVQLEGVIEVPSVRVIIAFVGIFLVVLAIGGLINYLLGKLVDSTGLSGTDRMFGALFGALRGLAIVLVAVIIAGFTPFVADPWWQQSTLLPEMERMATWLVGFFPESIQEYLPDKVVTEQVTTEADA